MSSIISVLQAHRQEMKWGVCKVENGDTAKIGPFLNAGCIMYSISIFILHLNYMGGGVHTNPPPCPWACHICLVIALLSFPVKNALLQRSDCLH